MFHKNLVKLFSQYLDNDHDNIFLVDGSLHKAIHNPPYDSIFLESFEPFENNLLTIFLLYLHMFHFFSMTNLDFMKSNLLVTLKKLSLIPLLWEVLSTLYHWMSNFRL
jgi:hypothetical protein